MKNILLTAIIIGSVISGVQAADKSGKELTSKCAACHGTSFEKAALGKSAIVKGQKAEDIEKSLKEYKNGNRNVHGMGSLMKGQTATLSDKDMKTVAKYIAEIK